MPYVGPKVKKEVLFQVFFEVNLLMLFEQHLEFVVLWSLGQYSVWRRKDRGPLQQGPKVLFRLHFQRKHKEEHGDNGQKKFLKTKFFHKANQNFIIYPY